MPNRKLHKFIIITIIVPLEHDSVIRREKRFRSSWCPRPRAAQRLRSRRKENARTPDQRPGRPNQQIPSRSDKTRRV